MPQIKKKKMRPEQHQTHQPGKESLMIPLPEFKDWHYRASDKLKNKVALITGGDSGIGRAIALCFAMEGADVAFTYYDEHDDAKKTKKLLETHGSKCISMSGDMGKSRFCKSAVEKTIKQLGKIDILINNAAEQHPKEYFEDITIKQMEKTFQTNFFAYFYMTKYAVPHLKKGSCIINTSSVTAYRGSAHLIDYSATKGAIISFTRSLALNLIDKGIRVNAVAPGPVWTPLIPASFDAHKVSEFGSNTPMKRAGEPKEIAPSYVFLASDDSLFMTGQVLHPNGGEIING